MFAGFYGVHPGQFQASIKDLEKDAIIDSLDLVSQL